ncbi:MAG: hypothetical protein ACTSPN_16330 [Promethearchaeota archaeon]
MSSESNVNLCFPSVNFFIPSDLILIKMSIVSPSATSLPPNFPPRRSSIVNPIPPW